MTWNEKFEEVSSRSLFYGTILAFAWTGGGNRKVKELNVTNYVDFQQKKLYAIREIY